MPTGQRERRRALIRFGFKGVETREDIARRKTQEAATQTSVSIFNTTDPHRFGVFVVAPEGVVRVTGLTHAQAKAWAQGER